MKPVYRVPTMEEISAIPHNGYDIVSTFSGCGGSCLGYRMAGFRVLWASEFVPAAQETYRANHPTSILDTRDIRKVKPEEILSATGKAKGEIDLLDGSPPCSSFSSSGKREAGWGEVKEYSDTKQRTDDLFFEYARILRGLMPRVFIAENVSGLLKGVAKGYFIEILRELKSCGYRVEARLLDAQWLGVPQCRQRVIFQGVREDLGASPSYPRPLPYRYTVHDAIGVLSVLQQGVYGKDKTTEGPCPTIKSRGIGGNRTIGKAGPVVRIEGDMRGFAVGEEWGKLQEGEGSDKYQSLRRASMANPSPTVTAIGGEPSRASVAHPTQCRKFTIAELRRICAFPDDFILTGSYARQWERMGRAVPPVMMSHIAATVRDEVLGRMS